MTRLGRDRATPQPAAHTIDRYRGHSAEDPGANAFYQFGELRPLRW
jgi:hypothetical protein